MKVNAYILAGGKSHRMGAPKGLKMLNGKPMIEHMIEKCSKLAEKVAIVGHPVMYKDLKLKVIGDLPQFSSLGPVSGIMAALDDSDIMMNLVIGCDLPLVTTEILMRLMMEAEDFDAFIPVHNGKLEPLCALYHKRILEPLNRIVQSGSLKISQIMDQFNVKYVSVENELQRHPYVFLNVNTPEDLNVAEEIIGKIKL